MKHVMITAILSLGIVAQSSLVSVDQIKPLDTGRAIETLALTSQAGPQQLTVKEAEVAVGGEATGCWTYLDEKGDTHGICCANLWIFSICVAVNVSAIERIIPFL